MKNLLLLVGLMCSALIFAAHHEEADSKDSDHQFNFVYTSDYTIPAGGLAKNVEKIALQNLATLEENGYYNCGLLRHQFGGDRAYYSYCYFDSWEQFGKINDANSPAAYEPKQVYGDHSDHLIAVVERNLTKRTAYVLKATYSFGPFLTANEMRNRAKTLFNAYDEAFGGCNLAEHAWGPELAWYFYCGYDSYADFAKKSNALAEIHESKLADQKLDIRNHSDDLMIRVR
tara:strand:- start:10 stop:699 length:690 start_codon:yes stop_codon:yes gene_type:complete